MKDSKQELLRRSFSEGVYNPKEKVIFCLRVDREFRKILKERALSRNMTVRDWVIMSCIEQMKEEDKYQ